MRGFLLVVGHPWFAPTAPSGSYALARVPAGKHTVIAFHPLHGEKRADVDVKPDSTVALDFTFTDADKAP
jgi:hypothetical protein